MDKKTFILSIIIILIVVISFGFVKSKSDKLKLDLDAENSFSFRDENGNVIKSFAFGGTGVLWVDSETYKLGTSNINSLKKFLINFDT